MDDERLDQLLSELAHDYLESDAPQPEAERSTARPGSGGAMQVTSIQVEKTAKKAIWFSVAAATVATVTAVATIWPMIFGSSAEHEQFSAQNPIVEDKSSGGAFTRNELVSVTGDPNQRTHLAVATDHVRFVMRINELLELYCAWNQYEEAELLYKQAMRVAIDEFGEEHAHTKKIRVRYLELLRNKERREPAEQP